MRGLMIEMLDIALEPLRQESFDFGTNDVAERLRDLGLALGERREIHHLPPIDTFYIQRKFGGMYLLASRLGARVALRGIVESHL